MYFNICIIYYVLLHFFLFPTFSPGWIRYPSIAEFGQQYWTGNYLWVQYFYFLITAVKGLCVSPSHISIQLESSSWYLTSLIQSVSRDALSGKETTSLFWEFVTNFVICQRRSPNFFSKWINMFLTRTNCWLYFIVKGMCKPNSLTKFVGWLELVIK